MSDLIVVKMYMLKGLYGIIAMRRLSMGLSDNMIVLCKMKLVGTWMRRSVKMVGKKE